ncbi:MAG: adenylate/guanylate cyclase domain-containing protein [Acidobacteriota bacterium]
MAELAAFLPWSFNDLVPAALEGGPRHRVVRGTVLFSDVAGFTPLTEALSVLGKEGAEELTRVLNAYFSRMIAIVGEEGGDVLRFGGDSMTILFPGPSPEPALRAASRMMEAMGSFARVYTRAGEFPLAMKIGAASGPVLLGIVGGGETAYDFYAAGPPLDASALAEHAAGPSEIVLDGSVGGSLPRGLACHAASGRRCLRGFPPSPPGHTPTRRPLRRRSSAASSRMCSTPSPPPHSPGSTGERRCSSSASRASPSKPSKEAKRGLSPPSTAPSRSSTAPSSKPRASTGATSTSWTWGTRAPRPFFSSEALGPSKTRRRWPPGRPST